MMLNILHRIAMRSRTSVIPGAVQLNFIELDVGLLLQDLLLFDGDVVSEVGLHPPAPFVKLNFLQEWLLIRSICIMKH